MGIFDKFKKKFDDGQKDDKTDKVSKEKAEAKAKVKADQTKSATVKKEDKVVKTVTDKKEKAAVISRVELPFVIVVVVPNSFIV